MALSQTVWGERGTTSAHTRMMTMMGYVRETSRRGAYPPVSLSLSILTF